MTLSLFPSDIVDSILFPTPRSTYDFDDFPDDLVWIPRSLDPKDVDRQDSVPCLLLTSPSARFFVFYLHSNAEDLGRCRQFCNVIRAQFQVHVLAVEYPGYGLCAGKANEETVLENSHLAFKFLREVLHWSLDEILVMGRSIGCGSAMSIASQHKVAGLILICPFISVRELFREFVGRVAEVIQERFPNLELMQRVSSPLLLVHGKLDTVVPWTHGQALYKACTARKRIIVPEKMHHNSNLLAEPSFFVLPMLQFFTLPDYSFEELDVPDWCYGRWLAGSTRSSPSGLLKTTDLFRGQPTSPLEGPGEVPPAEDATPGGTAGIAERRTPGAAALERRSSERPKEPGAPAEVPSALAWPPRQTRPATPPETPPSILNRNEGEGTPQSAARFDRESSVMTTPPPSPPPRERREGIPAHSPLFFGPSPELPPSKWSEEATIDLVEDRLERFLQMHMVQRAGNRDERTEEEDAMEEEVLIRAVLDEDESDSIVTEEVMACEDEDLANPPDDMGFHKVPQSRRGGPGNFVLVPGSGASAASAVAGGKGSGQPDCGSLLSCGAAGVAAATATDVPLRSTVAHRAPSPGFAIGEGAPGGGSAPCDGGWWLSPLRSGGFPNERSMGPSSQPHSPTAGAEQVSPVKFSAGMDPSHMSKILIRM
mmetsp:Transcript_26617/g.88290  ORF Transcript_26617/g.88290 Transcript_26617/m.88290 type:complete len:654 (-) Transcript_26617:54-2015(-)